MVTLKRTKGVYIATINGKAFPPFTTLKKAFGFIALLNNQKFN